MAAPAVRLIHSSSSASAKASGVFARQRMAGRQDQHQFVFAKEARVQACGVGPFDKHRRVGPAFAQGGHHRFGHLLLEVDVHLRMQLAVARQQRRQKLADGGAAGAQAYVARDAAPQVRQFAAQLLHGLQQGQAVLDEDAPGGRGQEAARVALEQASPSASSSSRMRRLAAASARCESRAAAVRLPVCAQATARRTDTRSKRARL
jgi:hypothetical protein